MAEPLTKEERLSRVRWARDAIKRWIPPCPTTESRIASEQQRYEATVEAVEAERDALQAEMWRLKALPVDLEALKRYEDNALRPQAERET